MTVRFSIVYFNNHSCFLRNVQKGTHHEMIGELFMISQTRAFVYVAVVPKYATLTWKDKVNSSVSPADPKRFCPVTPPGLGKVQENH
jgi:hypothetical protein